MKYFVFLILSLLTPQIEADHEFHMSKCEIAFNEAEQAIQISLHLFIDDLETALAAKGISNLYICTDKEDAETEQYIADYLQETFALQVDGKAVSYSFLGKEPSEDLEGIWCYLEIETIASIQELNVRNQILTQAFDDQRNIVSITKSGVGRMGYFLFDKDSFEDTVSFE